jgi:mannose-6-phosphate isomerase-like protein (cupin superfamily)
MDTTAAPLAERYWFVTGNEARLIDVPVPEFWEQVMSGAPSDPAVRDVVTEDGWLVSTYTMTADMTHVEMHPAGDELHYLVSGRLGLVLEEDGGERVVALEPGSSAVVPKGVWHRFVVTEPGTGVAVTFGRGTEHRPLAG